MAEKADDEHDDRQAVADRAHRRAAEAGARASELRDRLADLRAPASAPDSRSDHLERARQAAAHAIRRRDEAARHDQAAHEASARAHTRAAAAYELLAATAEPGQRPEYIHRARIHREAARANHLSAGPPTEDPPANA